MTITKNLYVLFGGAGFIGTNIYNRLLHPDTYFLVIDRESKIRFVDDVPEELKNHVNSYHNHLDFTDSDGFKYLYKAVSYFIENTINQEDPSDKFKWNITFVHLASTVGVTNNIGGNFGAEMRITQNIIHHIKEIMEEYSNWFERVNICYTSTSELFGESSHKFHKYLNLEEQEDLFDLTCLYSPKYSERSEYIYQKYIGEKLFKNLNLQLNEFCSNTHVFILRLFNIIGPFQDTDKGVFSKFVVDIIRGKGSLCSDSIRRYVPVKAVTDFFNPYNKALFGVPPKGLTSVMVTGHEKLLCCTGEDLYINIRAYLKRKYPNCKGISKSVYQLDFSRDKNGIDKPKEIFKRFEPNIVNDEAFELYYGPFIEAIIRMQIKYGPLSKSTLGIVEQNENEPLSKSTLGIMGKDDSELEFPGEVINYQDGLALIDGLIDHSAGDLVLFENGEKGVLSNGILTDNEAIPTCVILGKGDNIKIGMRCKLDGRLEFPKVGLNVK